MAASEILQLGHPTLRVKCSPVKKFAGPDLGKLVNDLRDTLNEFRARHGFGRGIAAPQIGSSVRVIFINVDRPMELINPVIVRRSRRMMTLWDDCFSFPTLVAKVRRNLAVEVRYQDIEGKHHALKAEGALSELLQHEIDHIDGILAIDRAIDTKHIVYRTEYDTQAAKRESVAL